VILSVNADALGDLVREASTGRSSWQMNASKPSSFR
jgi:hypothetical protein